MDEKISLTAGPSKTWRQWLIRPFRIVARRLTQPFFDRLAGRAEQINEALGRLIWRVDLLEKQLLPSGTFDHVNQRLSRLENSLGRQQKAWEALSMDYLASTRRMQLLEDRLLALGTPIPEFLEAEQEPVFPSAPFLRLIEEESNRAAS